MKRIGLLSDTHGHLDDRILHHLQGMDEIWHAGDIGNLRVTDDLRKIAPLRAVYGNIDGTKIRAEFPLHQRFTIEGMKVWITHIGGKPGRYDMKVRQQLYIDRPDIFICGHSHICKVMKDPQIDAVYMNPGAAGINGFHHVRTMLRFRIEEGKVKELEVIELGPRIKMVKVEEE